MKSSSTIGRYGSFINCGHGLCRKSRLRSSQHPVRQVPEEQLSILGSTQDQCAPHAHQAQENFTRTGIHHSAKQLVVAQHSDTVHELLPVRCQHGVSRKEPNFDLMDSLMRTEARQFGSQSPIQKPDSNGDCSADNSPATSSKRWRLQLNWGWCGKASSAIAIAFKGNPTGDLSDRTELFETIGPRPASSCVCRGRALRAYGPEGRPRPCSHHCRFRFLDSRRESGRQIYKHI
mmetsp:Transcript_42517/g.77633  ORF Transcript_42517/g.77633 Transcript_42517/m.77633 type:complete len:233 (-) Transcript_42517:60-758(-)